MDITQKFVVDDVQKSKQWPAWKGKTEQVHICLRKRGRGTKGVFHLYVPAGHKLAKSLKGAHVAIFIHPPVK